MCQTFPRICERVVVYVFAVFIYVRVTYVCVCLRLWLSVCERTQISRPIHLTVYGSKHFFFISSAKMKMKKKQTRTKLSLKNVDPVVRNLSIFTKIKCTILQEIGTRSRYFWDGKCYRAKEDVFDEVERKTRAFAESINAWKPSTMLALAKRRKRNTIWETKRSGRKQDNSE